MVQSIRAADLARLAEERIATLRTKSRHGASSNSSSRRLNSSSGGRKSNRRASRASKASQRKVAIVVDLAAERLVTGANGIAALVRIWLFAALELLGFGLRRRALREAAEFSDAVDDNLAALGLVCWADLVTALVGVCLSGLECLLCRWAFGEASELSDSVDDDFAALGFVGRADLVAAFVWVCLSSLDPLDGWAFGEASDFSDSVDNDFTAFRFICRADLIAALVGICLGNSVNDSAKGEGHESGVEEHVE